MELTPYLMWNVLLTLVVAPLFYTIRSIFDVLANSTVYDFIYFALEC